MPTKCLKISFLHLKHYKNHSTYALEINTLHQSGWWPIQINAEEEEGSEEGVVKLPKINGCPRGWKPYFLQVLHSLIPLSSPLRLPIFLSQSLFIKVLHLSHSLT